MQEQKMAKIVSLFNHKGGVSKTTTTYNLGWSLAESGKRVLIVDADPQCNLTGTVLGFDGDHDFQQFYSKKPNSNLNDCMTPVFQGQQTLLKAAQIVPTQKDNLFLLAGHIDLSESEAQLSIALSTGAALPALQNLPGAIGHLLRVTATENKIDIVLVDMSPSVGALNQCLLMASDYFIVPTSPDYFCNQAIGSLAKVLPRWNSSVLSFRNAALTYPFPSQSPKFIGIISQRYRPRDNAPAASFQKWIDRIKDSINSQLIPVLNPLNMAISEKEFRNAGAADAPYNLANIADFNSLIAQSQKHNRPIFALTDAQIEQQGTVLENMKENRKNFRKTFSSLAEIVIKLAGI
jgi:cellulose biosynthesis protein BcsQ